MTKVRLSTRLTEASVQAASKSSAKIAGARILLSRESDDQSRYVYLGGVVCARAGTVETTGVDVNQTASLDLPPGKEAFVKIVSNP
jgi:hypothetical protein